MNIKHFSPVFLIGCGRSGTSILGKIISKHSDIVYLNEPREIWSAGYTETDIWTKHASTAKGRLFMGQNDEVPEKSDILRHLFISELKKTNKGTLIEKLPINTFRLGLINKIFPESRYIHIYRNGFDVARSIEERCVNGRWFGVDEYKLAQLKKYAKSKKQTKGIPELCQNYFEKGLMEWRLSVESIVLFLSGIESTRYFELSYEALINNPVAILRDMFGFLNLQPESNVLNYAVNNLKRKERKDSKDNNGDYTQKNMIIGGKLLSLCMHNEKNPGLVRHKNLILGSDLNSSSSQQWCKQDY